MRKYKLINYDCLHDGNSWSVNDAHYTGLQIELPDNASDKQVRQALFKSGFTNRGILTAKLDIHGEDEYSIYVDLTGTRYQGFKPFCELRNIEV